MIIIIIQFILLMMVSRFNFLLYSLTTSLKIQTFFCYLYWLFLLKSFTTAAEVLAPSNVSKVLYNSGRRSLKSPQDARVA
mmetsp:Transcript_109570/g.251257  ORF Transcript_109570/g.251257 Transcript_109570/m.251257 type:complete len:80 (-) Transcript_109570:483-722(-)